MSTITEPGSPVLRHAVTVPLDLVEWRDSGDPSKKHETTLRGHAAVFNSMSDDLGGFREILAPGAFNEALAAGPDVRLLLNHDSNYVMARTASGTLELREDATGLQVFARVDRRISWVEDLRVSMQRGDLDQMSFAFNLADDGDDWAVTDDGQVVRTIRSGGISELFDVSVVAYPAYTTTSADMRSVLDDAIVRGRVPGITPVAATLPGATLIEPGTAGSEAGSRNAGSDHMARREALGRVVRRNDIGTKGT